MEKIVEIKGLSKKYRNAKEYAIKDINLECYAGEIVGLLGKNGAGKSTTIKCLTGFFAFDEGTIKICGYDIVKDDINAKKQIGYVPDNHALFDRMTGIEYIDFIANIQKVDPVVRKMRIEEMEKIFNLGPALYQLISSYSHGMRQKVSIMASLIHEPKLWLLDEPLTGLDPQTSKALRDYMEVYKKKNNTVLYSSHNLDAVEKTCDRVYIISNGTIYKAIDINQFKTENPDKTLEDAFIEIFEN